MALQRLTFRLRQTVSHVRTLHSTTFLQQEPLALQSDPEPSSIFRTRESNPAFHSEDHVGQYYTLPPSDIRATFPHGLPPKFRKQVKTFNEACFMVRQPSLEVISSLKETDFSKPATRYLFYGVRGSGKTMSLCHAVHYCFTQGWLVVHIPDAFIWLKNCKELLPSTYNDSRFDQPLQAVEWLRNFKITNEKFLSKIKTKHRYMWTKRESTEEGVLLGQLVDQGISRVKSSSDVMCALLKELRLQSGQPESDFRLAVAMDGVNALWGRCTIKKENKSFVEPEELTVVRSLRKMVKNDWTGGAIITTLSQTGSLFIPKSVYLPHEMLGEKGFDSMDPFLPVSVPNYDEREFESCYLYYIDRHWLQLPQSRTEDGKKELAFLTNRNPKELEKVSAFL